MLESFLQTFFIMESSSKTKLKINGKNEKYKYVTDEETLPSNQSQTIKQARFTYSLVEKAFKKQTETVESQGQKL